jgi:hypothetical protein
MPEKHDDYREELAALCHSQWSGWIDYMWRKSIHNDDGTITIPKWAVDRWTRQSITAYADLPEAEKDSDRAEADKFLALR